jgi:ribosome-binding factor A
VIQREMRDPRIGMLSITDVIVSKDLSYADVYFTTVSAQQDQYEDKDKDEILRALQGAAGFLRSILSKRHVMRTTPALRFHYDELIQSGPQLEALIERALASDQIRGACLSETEVSDGA